MAANGSGNTLTNHGTIATGGPNAYGMTAAWGQTNAGQFNNTLINSGTVTTSGSNARRRRFSVAAAPSTTAARCPPPGPSSNGRYLQGNTDQLINSGTIGVSGSGSDAVFSNTAGSSFTATIQNLAGGRSSARAGPAFARSTPTARSSMPGLCKAMPARRSRWATAMIRWCCKPDPMIIGTANGGGGTNTVTLQGSGTASKSFTNFQTLLMQGGVVELDRVAGLSRSGACADRHAESRPAHSARARQQTGRSGWRDLAGERRRTCPPA